VLPTSLDVCLKLKLGVELGVRAVMVSRIWCCIVCFAGAGWREAVVGIL
jgi:hypothetical protein